MKILLIMAGFFPGKKYGGPPVSADNFCSLMKSDECFIITTNHDMNELNPYEGIQNDVWIKRDNCSVMYVSNRDYNKTTFRNVILEINPDILYLQGLFQKCVLPCLMLSKKLKIKVLLAPRGELCEGAFKKKYKKIPYILLCKFMNLFKNVHFQSTSEEETLCIKKYLGVIDNRIHFLTNVPSIPNKKYIRNEKKTGEAKFIFLSRVHPKKNLISAIKYFKSIKGKAVFDIYGPIEDEGYWKECKQEIDRLPDNIVVNYCGLVSHDEVHQVLSLYDAFVFPTFSENYGHVIAESLIVGTPVLLGKGTTPWDDINGVAGFTADLNDHEAFVAYINSIIDMDCKEYASLTHAVFRYINDKLELDHLRKEYDMVLKMISRDGV